MCLHVFVKSAVAVFRRNAGEDIPHQVFTEGPADMKRFLSPLDFLKTVSCNMQFAETPV